MIKNLIVFLKIPRLGKVKTRLAKDVGSERALHIYEWLTDHTLMQAHKVDAKLHLYIDETPKDDLHINFSSYHLQKGNDLGEMMYQAISEIQPNGPVVLIGSDCPEINPAIINEAFDALNKNEVVIGPALDGGFYLIAVKHIPDNIFNNVEWGSETVMKDVLQNLEHQSVYQLPILSDLDNVNDFRKFEPLYEKYLKSKSILVETEN